MKWICIGLVGHVANGKTTLVKALTGVNTKRNSSEIKSGRTIKLGYANCIVWHCNKCQKVVTTGQEQKSCVCCSENMEMTNRISFVDSPGHHTYVKTMIRGTSIIDCAIIVTDVRSMELQPQTLEHLAILEVLGIKNCIVIQNKIDLVTNEKCVENYKMLKTQLKSTVAKNAPIIPISAQNSIGIEYVQKYIYKLINNIEIPEEKSSLFTIVRSFNINKPNSDIEELKGGVIGGTFLGKKCYKEGEILEIRPGIILRDKIVPIYTKVLSFFSEKEKCTELHRGGLYGIGTTLDPTLTKSDNLIGSLMGRTEELPEILYELKIKVTKVKGAHSMKKDDIFNLIIGNTSVTATVFEKLQNAAIFKLQKPICIYQNKAIIYSSSVLYGFGIIENIKETIANNIEEAKFSEQKEFEYIHMLPNREERSKSTLKLPIPVMLRENTNTLWTNITFFSQSIKRESSSISTYIQQELCLQASMCNQGLRIYKTKVTPSRLEIILKKFIKEKVCCEQCNSINTSVKNKTEITCNDCHSERILL